MKLLLYLAIATLLIPSCHAGDTAPADPFATARQGMIESIRADYASLGSDRRMDANVRSALGSVPRHAFVPEKLHADAYANRPLPIGYGQTISQPFIVAFMTDLLAITPGQRILEIGTGSGYQAAVLAEMGAKVYTIEIISALGEPARERLRRLGYKTVETRIGDGYYGWEAAAPFDGIIVTAAANHIPPPLIAQLKPEARMVIPVGSRFGTQHLIIVQKDGGGRVTTQKILPVRFVPLTGGKRE